MLECETPVLDLCSKEYSDVNYKETIDLFFKSCNVFNHEKCEMFIAKNHFRFWIFFSLITIIFLVAFVGYFTYRYLNLNVINLLKRKFPIYNLIKNSINPPNISNQSIQQINSIETIKSKLTKLEPPLPLSPKESAKLKQFEEHWLYPLDASKDYTKFVRYYDHTGSLIKRPKNLHDLEKQEISLKYYRRHATNEKDIFIFEGPTSSKSLPEKPMVFQFDNY